jgi:hypothetical protein
MAARTAHRVADGYRYVAEYDALIPQQRDFVRDGQCR